MQDLIKALESTEMMDAYLELNSTETIINEIRDYAETQALKQIITGNEPAQPFTAATENELLTGHITGLSIRQEFAARFMQALLSNPAITSLEHGNNYSNHAKDAVANADGLIEALNK